MNNIQKNSLIVLIVIFLTSASFFAGTYFERKLGKKDNAENFLEQKQECSIEASLFSFGPNSGQTDEQSKKLLEKIGEIVQSKDEKRCTEIEGEIQQKACRSMIAQNLAFEKNDDAYCQKIDPMFADRENCVKNIELSKAQQGQNSAACEKLSDENSKITCLYNFWKNKALKEGNMALCDNISQEMNKFECQNEYQFTKEFMANQENFACDKFLGGDLKSDCELWQQAKEHDAVFCMQLKSSYFESFCQGSFTNQVVPAIQN